MAAIHLGETGSTYYAKLEGSSISPWSTGVVAFTPSTMLGVFTAATNDALAYIIYLQAGGSPASSDDIDAIIGISSVKVGQSYDYTNDITSEVASVTVT